MGNDYYTAQDVRDVESVIRLRILQAEISATLLRLSMAETDRLTRGMALETSGAVLVAANDPVGHYDSPILDDIDNEIFGCNDKIALRRVQNESA